MGVRFLFILLISAWTIRVPHLDIIVLYQLISDSLKTRRQMILFSSAKCFWHEFHIMLPDQDWDVSFKWLKFMTRSFWEQTAKLVFSRNYFLCACVQLEKLVQRLIEQSKGTGYACNTFHQFWWSLAFSRHVVVYTGKNLACCAGRLHRSSSKKEHGRKDTFLTCWNAGVKPARKY